MERILCLPVLLRHEKTVWVSWVVTVSRVNQQENAGQISWKWWNWYFCKLWSISHSGCMKLWCIYNSFCNHSKHWKLFLAEVMLSANGPWLSASYKPSSEFHQSSSHSTMVCMHNMLLYLLHMLCKHQLSKQWQEFGSNFALYICGFFPFPWPDKIKQGILLVLS